ncbi:hypothetical protein SAMN02745121_07869 [Nannocystis exedens]|uniref:Uncharacterized protein n=1 Tax=Nannocystis exedens TaxID=54 RepID=A0A1I2HFG4_9BACT|nr:hypothetical protein [Nannocystis exedens]PCC67832.1 hypothetical protein NAEX_00840 [Nannocystis exedens]SFF27496.1 hypothetical protein SAMN02745121_07869 [Nannocystis exedens]
MNIAVRDGIPRIKRRKDLEAESAGYSLLGSLLRQEAKVVGVYEFTPVIFSGTAGGAGEYHASNDPDRPEEHIIDAGIPAGARIVEAWYTAFHNIGALVTFALIDVNRHNDRQVRLSAASYVNQNQRIRLKIHVLYEMAGP